MSKVASHHEQKLDQRPAEPYHTAVVDVVAAVEIEAGLREIVTPTRHTYLDRCPDGKAGPAPLADITAHNPASRLPADGSNSPASPEVVSSEHATSNTILLELFRAVESGDLSMRLAIRSHPIFHLTDHRDRVHTLVRNLDAINDFAHLLASALDCILRRTLDRALVGELDLPGDLARSLDRDLDLAREVAHDLDRHLDLARDLARHLADDLAHIRDLALLPRLDLDYALDQILKIPQTSDYTRLSGHSLVRDLGCVNAMVDDIDRVCSCAHDFAQTLGALIHLHHVLSDVSLKPKAGSG